MGNRVRMIGASVSALVIMVGLNLGFHAPMAMAAGDTENAPNPAFWPLSPTVSPRISGYANAVRFAGDDRFSTSLSLALALRGRGGFPFESPARQTIGATNLDQNHNWWGAATCPRSLIIVAGDNPADALAASSLSDPTGNSTEPFLQRSAAADPLFDPIGGFNKVDTDNAPIIVTAAARSGASLLTPAANAAVRDLVNGGCHNVWQAIVVGGTQAVPAAVDNELVSLGVPEVFRVSGANRYATAAAIAKSLDTTDVPADITDCVSPTATTNSTKMGFYANSVVEYRSNATECELLGRTVVLADGLVGADALAAGWWTSFWQTPVLLHDGETSLPNDTANALETRNIDTIIALGGARRIPEMVLDEAKSLTGATVIRVSGSTRYETSVAMAKHFGGWWPASEEGVDPDTPNTASFANSIVCFAASSGEAASAQGWPDALGAGPLCASLNGAVLAQNSNATSAPTRYLAPTNGANPHQTPLRGSAGSKPGHEAVPIILLPASDASGDSSVSTLATSVEQFLSEIFSADETWCSSDNPTNDCVNPGFAVVVGGEAVISEANAHTVSSLVGGNMTNTNEPDAKIGAEPALTSGFYTNLNMSPVFDVVSSAIPTPVSTPPGWFCASREDYEDVRWLAVFPTGELDMPLASLDVITNQKYVSDTPTATRSIGKGAPVCMVLPDVGDDGLDLLAISLAGRTTPRDQIRHLNPAVHTSYALDSPVQLSGPNKAIGQDSSLATPPGDTTSWTFNTADSSVQPPAPTVTSLGETETVLHAAITLELTRGALPPLPPDYPSSGPPLVATHIFNGSWSISTEAGTISGQTNGEAVLDSGVWKLRGVAISVGGTWNVPAGLGGFSADIAVNNAGNLTDDAISWQLDGVLSD